MLHKVDSDNADAISYYNPDRARIQKLVTSGTSRKVWSSQGTSSASVSVSTGQDMNKKYTLDFNNGYPRIMTVTYKGYISGGPYYFSWALKNFTTGNMIPNMIHDVKGGSIYGGTGSNTRRTISTLAGNLEYNCGIVFTGGVHNLSSQLFATFDLSYESHGDVIGLVMNASSGGGSSWYSTGGQTLYASHLVAWMGSGGAGIQYDLDYA